MHVCRATHRYILDEPNILAGSRKDGASLVDYYPVVDDPVTAFQMGTEW